MTIEKAQPCPFCKIKECTFLINARLYEVSIVCSICGVEGPKARWTSPDQVKIMDTLQSQAIDYWNGTVKWEKPKK